MQVFFNIFHFLLAYLRKKPYLCTAFRILGRFDKGRGGGIGRHEGLKILWPETAVWVQVPPAVQQKKRGVCLFFLFMGCLIFVRVSYARSEALEHILEKCL